MSESKTDSFDWGLINALRQPRERDRKQFGKTLVRQTFTDYDELVASNNSLKKQNKALYDRLRRMPAKKSTKAKLGFKQKTEKSTVQIDTSSSSSQITAI